MADITRQQILDAIKASEGNLDAKIKGLEIKMDVGLGDLERKLETKLDNLETRLTRQVSNSQTVNVNHHLEIRAEIGNLNKRIIAITDGLAKAAGAA